MVTKAEILKQVEENNVEFIRFWFTDINGILKSFAITKDELEGGLKGVEEDYKLAEPMELNLYHLNDEERAERGIRYSA